MYYRTGDIGERDGDKLIIIDRHSLIKLAAGEWVSPNKIEVCLELLEYIEFICVYGISKYNYVVAVVSPNDAYYDKFKVQRDDENKKLDEYNSELLKLIRNF
eukprot:UN02695